jgi:hypothetical protein
MLRNSAHVCSEIGLKWFLFALVRPSLARENIALKAPGALKSWRDICFITDPLVTTIGAMKPALLLAREFRRKEHEVTRALR